MGIHIVSFLALIVNSQHVNALFAVGLSAILNAVMNRKRRKKDERPVFDSIRKPTAPPSRKIGQEKPNEKARPSLRKTKYKRKIEPNGDI